MIIESEDILSRKRDIFHSTPKESVNIFNCSKSVNLFNLPKNENFTNIFASAVNSAPLVVGDDDDDDEGSGSNLSV